MAGPLEVTAYPREYYEWLRRQRAAEGLLAPDLAAADPAGMTYVPGPDGDMTSGQWVPSEQVETRAPQDPTFVDALDEQTAGGRQMIEQGLQDIANDPTRLNPLSPQGILTQGQMALGGLDALAGVGAAVAGSILDEISQLTGISADRSNKSRNAGDARMMMDVAMPELAGGGALLGSGLTARQGMQVAGELADQRLAERGSAFAGQAGQLNSGVDPTKALANAADRAVSALKPDMWAPRPSIAEILKANPELRKTPEDLRDALVMPTMADRMDAGGIYSGIDASKIDDPQRMYGGPGFPLLDQYRDNNVAWANQGDAIATDKFTKQPDLISVNLMSDFAHLSNATSADSLIQTAAAYARDGRLMPEDLAEFDAKIRQMGEKNEKLKSLTKFPGIESPSVRDWMRPENSSFEARMAIAKELKQPGWRDKGFPNVERFRQETIDKRFADQPLNSVQMLLKPDYSGGAKAVDLREMGIEHPSYQYGLPGKLWGILEQPVSAKALQSDWWESPQALLQEPKDAYRGFSLQRPVTKVGQDQIDRMNMEWTGGNQPLLTPAQKRLFVMDRNGAWKTQAVGIKDGGLSPTDYQRAIENSPYKPALTNYSAKDIEQGYKNGTFEAFQLGDSQVFFGIDKKPDYSWAGVDSRPGDKALVGVVNNEANSKGFAVPSIMAKALENGVNVLDAFAVKSKNHPNGFLPTYYGRFGWKEEGRVPFSKEYYIADHGENAYNDLLDAWRRDGWDESQGFPDVVVMRWEGSDADRQAAISRIRGEGEEGLRPRETGLANKSSVGATGRGSDGTSGREGLLGGDNGRGTAGPSGIDLAGIPGGYGANRGAIGSFTSEQLRAAGVPDEQIIGLLGPDAVKRPIDNYKDPAPNLLGDWDWRPATEVADEVGLQKQPKHVQNFGKFMDEMATKAGKTGLTSRDLIKAFTITRSSIQRQAVNADKVRAAGLKLDPSIKTIRPEGAFSEWLFSPSGQRYLNAAEKGEVDQKAIADAVKVMAPFGKHETDIPQALTWAAQNLPGREKQASDLVARAKEYASTPDEWREFAKEMFGIGPSKAGFFASLVGRGDLPTLDARQVILHTGKPTKEASKYIARKGGKGGDEAVDRLAARQAAMAVKTPKALQPYYQHLTHHSVWDAVGKEKTTHEDVMRAMRLAGIGGLGFLGANSLMPDRERDGKAPLL